MDGSRVMHGAGQMVTRKRKRNIMNIERMTNMEKIIKRLGNLLSVKSLVTLVLTGVFAYMSVAGKISQDFMSIYAVIIAFYFGTQSQKVQDAVDGGTA